MGTIYQYKYKYLKKLIYKEILIFRKNKMYEQNSCELKQNILQYILESKQLDEFDNVSLKLFHTITGVSRGCKASDASHGSKAKTAKSACFGLILI